MQIIVMKLLWIDKIVWRCSDQPAPFLRKDADPKMNPAPAAAPARPAKKGQGWVPPGFC